MFGTISQSINPGIIDSSVKLPAEQAYNKTVIMPCGALLTVAAAEYGPEQGEVSLFAEGGERYIFPADQLVEIAIWKEGV